MAEPINNPVKQEPTPGAGGEATFTQAEVDALVSKEKARAVAKATKGMPDESELTAFRAWKDSQQTEQERWDNLTRERDTVKTQLTAAQAEIEQYKREKLLLSKGVPAEDVDYYSFKIGKLVSEDKTFEQAAEEYMKTAKPKGVRVDMSARLGGGGTPKTANEEMNALIRGAFK